MSYKVGFILSLIFIAFLIVLQGDVFAMQTVYTNLDAASVTAGHIISQKGRITDEVIYMVEQQCGGKIEEVGKIIPMMGEIFTYKISKDYNSYILYQHSQEIAVVRSVVIGYMS